MLFLISGFLLCMGIVTIHTECLSCHLKFLVSEVRWEMFISIDMRALRFLLVDNSESVLRSLQTVFTKLAKCQISAQFS